MWLLSQRKLCDAEGVIQKMSSINIGKQLTSDQVWLSTNQVTSDSYSNFVCKYLVKCEKLLFKIQIDNAQIMIIE